MAWQHATVHDGAVYLPQGDTYVVDYLDLGDATAFVDAATPDFTTTARDVTDIRVRSQDRGESWGDARPQSLTE